MSMGANGILAYPPSVYFPNIGFNNDFYSIPNNGTGITLNYANTHYLFSTGNASSSAITTFFSGSIGIGSPPSGISGDLIALTISANNISASNIQENGVNLSSKYYTISNALILSNTLTSNINLKESILTFSAPLTRSVNTIGIDLSSYLTSATAASTYYTIANATTLSNTLTSNINLKQNTLTTSTVLSGIGSNITLINYNTLSNLPNLSVYALNSSLSSYQPLLTTSTTLTGVGSNITLINYNTLSNLPNLSVYALNSSLASYQPLLTTSTVLNGIGSNITLINYNTLSNLPNLAQYLTITSASSTYLPLTGGTLSGNLTGTTINATGTLQEKGSNLSSIYVSSNVLSSNLIPYTTSNICQNLIIGNANINKKYSFSFTCSTAITINATTYYKYDIDLRVHTQTLYVPISNSPYRIFTLRIFVTSAYFEVFNSNIPNILSYEIYMSYQASPANIGTSIGNAGINICALGTPKNELLNEILPLYVTLIRTNDFNYLTVLSTVNNTKISCIIEDLLS